MVIDGHTSRDVADRFGLSVRTVDNHLAHVFTKLGIASRAELRDALHRWRPPAGDRGQPDDRVE